jgi:hypothetical protein
MDSTAAQGGENFVAPKLDIPDQEIPNIGARLGNLEDLTKNIQIVIVISLAGMVVSIILAGIALVMDQLHFNNEIYRDKSYNHTTTVEKFVNSQPPTPANPLGNLR